MDQMVKTVEFIILLCVNIGCVGIFIGYVNTSMRNISRQLNDISEKQDEQNEEIHNLRERVAVIENILDIRKRRQPDI